MTVSILGWARPAPSNPETDGYNLQRIEIQGIVENLENQEAYLRTDDGQEVRVQLGPQSYWDERGYYLSEGEYVRMEAWYDPYRYTDWYFAGEIWGPGFHFVLTNGYGVPYWVIARDDYYYSLGYRASCVSYMVWFDCPPAYFVYVIFPPPPPLYYSCYYGPRWQHHYTDWHRHGSDYGDRSGWNGPGPRGGRRDGYNGGPRGPRQENGGKYIPPREDDKWASRDRGVPVDPPKVKPRSQPRPDPKWQAPRARPQQPRQDQWQNRSAKPQPRNQPKYQRPTTSPRQESKYQRNVPSPRNDRQYQPRSVTPRSNPKYRAPAPSPERRVQVRVPKYQERPTKPQVREQQPPKGKAPRQYSPPQRSRQSSGTSAAQRSSSGRSQEHKNGRR